MERRDHRPVFGMGIERGLSYLATHYRLPDADTLIAEYVALWECLVRERLEPTHGAARALENLSAAGIPMALVTSGDSGYVRLVDQRLGFLRYFEVCITSDSVSKPKPSPEPYLTATRALTVSPRSCVGVEDSESGIRSVLAAGMYCVSVPGKASGEAAPHESIASLEKFDLEMIARLFSAEARPKNMEAR